MNVRLFFKFISRLLDSKRKFRLVYSLKILVYIMYTYLYCWKYNHFLKVKHTHTY